ncbi:STAS domain-containing protein [Planctomicrobium piriforme]|uniref:STAS domain-containing protein n=1 Tax=Planctomicrobium piriforme TaxID=1576369 RepID=UPI0015879F39|nr:STAS domain-containing protein [Planctomicrobium piriforme]
MSTTAPPCELVSVQDYVTVILRPSVVQSSWTDIEAFGSDVRSELERRTAPACVVDLSPLNYMGSAIVALIVRVWKVVQARDGRMVVVCPNAAVLEVIRLAGLDKIWTVTPRLEDAQKKLGVKGSSASIPMVTTSPASPEAGGVPSSRIWYFTMGALTVLLALIVVLVIAARR